VRAITAPKHPAPIMPCPSAPEQRLGALNDACNSRTFQIVGTRLLPQQRGPCGTDVRQVVARLCENRQTCDRDHSVGSNLVIAITVSEVIMCESLLVGGRNEPFYLRRQS